jgi:hypothetical protein
VFGSVCVCEDVFPSLLPRCAVLCCATSSIADYRADAEWLMDLPYVLTLPEFGAAVVHAGLAPGVALDAQLPYHMTCMRNLRPAAPGANNAVGGYEVFETAAPGAESWAPLWSVEDAESILQGCHLYFGHDAARRLQRCEHATGLDTGCCYGKLQYTVVICNINRSCLVHTVRNVWLWPVSLTVVCCMSRLVC